MLISNEALDGLSCLSGFDPFLQQCPPRLTGLLPVLREVKRPLEFEMRLVIVIDESRGSIIMTTSHHAGGGFFRRELLDMYWLVNCVWRVRTDHFLVLAERNTFSLQLLDILETRQDLMLDDEGGFHLICATFLNGKRLLLQSFQGTRSGEVDSDVGATSNLEGEGLDDAESRVIGVGDGVTGANAKGCLPSVQGLIFLVWKWLARRLGGLRGRSGVAVLDIDGIQFRKMSKPKMSRSSPIFGL